MFNDPFAVENAIMNKCVDAARISIKPMSMYKNMEPTIGRIVQFKTEEGTVYPAIITRVWSPTMVNLQVFRDLVCEAFTSVPQGDDVRQWDWLPFTKTQSTLERK